MLFYCDTPCAFHITMGKAKISKLINFTQVFAFFLFVFIMFCINRTILVILYFTGRPLKLPVWV